MLIIDVYEINKLEKYAGFYFWINSTCILLINSNPQNKKRNNFE